MTCKDHMMSTLSFNWSPAFHSSIDSSRFDALFLSFDGKSDLQFQCICQYNSNDYKVQWLQCWGITTIVSIEYQQRHLTAKKQLKSKYLHWDKVTCRTASAKVDRGKKIWSQLHRFCYVTCSRPYKQSISR